MSTDNFCTPPMVRDPLHRFYPRFGKRGLDVATNERSIMDAARGYTCGALFLPWNSLDLWENPPYSNLLRFTVKAMVEVALLLRGQQKELVRLVPVATSTEWWEKSLRGKRKPLLVYTKRIPFIDESNPLGNGARFDSVLQVYARSARREEEFCDLFAPIIKTVVHGKHHRFPEAA